MTLDDLLDLRAQGVPTTIDMLVSVLFDELTKELDRYYRDGHEIPPVRPGGWRTSRTN